MDAADVIWVIQQYLLAFDNPNATERIERNIVTYISNKYELGADVDAMPLIKEDFEWAGAFAREMAHGMGIGHES